LILKDDPQHHHYGHSHDHAHGAHHHDLNLRAAYLHVLADALTSVKAITALSLGYFLGWVWLDPVMGLVGTVVIVSWAYTLVRDQDNILVAFQMQAWRKLSRSGACAFPLLGRAYPENPVPPRDWCDRRRDIQKASVSVSFQYYDAY